MKSTLPLAGPVRTAPRAVLVASVDPLVWVLFLAGVFDGLSDNWVHATLLLGAAAAVWRDAWHRARGQAAAPPVALLAGGGARPGRQILLVAAAVAYALIVGSFARYTWPVTVAIVAPAAVVLVAGWRGPLRARPVPAPMRIGSTLAWAGLGIAAGLWELVALLLQPSLQANSWSHPTISYLMDSVLAGHTGRALTLLAWLGLGWWLLTHAPARPRGEPADELA